MWRTTIRGVLARKVRLALTALSVVLGVTFIAGTYVLTDTLKHSFDSVFAQTAIGVDSVVRSRQVLDGNDQQRDRVPDAVLNSVRTVPGVGAAEGVVQGYAQFVAHDGRTAVSSGGAPTLGISWGSSDRVGPLRIEHGRRPVRSGEVAMDAGTARKHGFKVGDRVKVLLTGPAQRFTIVGTFGFGTKFDLGGVTFAAFETRTAQRVFDAEGSFDVINVTAAPGTSSDQLARNLRVGLPGYAVDSATKVADETARPVRQGLSFINDALLGFAAVGVFVGAFIIFNTFTILVSQRTRELGLLRAMGASRRQIVSSVIVEALVVGAFASALGLVLGVALGRAFPSILESFGLDFPTGGTIVLPRTIVVAIVVGMGVTIGSAVYPAVRAARISPIAAIGELGPTKSAPLRARVITGVVVIALGGGVVAYGLAGHFVEITNRLEVVGIGALLTFVGVATVSPVAARPLSRLIGAPLPSTIGVSGTLARGNAMRNPRRTAATASALVIGLSLVCLVAIFASSAKASVRAALDTGVRSDLILTAQQFAGFSTELSDRLRPQPAVSAAVGFRFADGRIRGNDEQITGAEPQGLTDVVNLGFVSGGAAGLARGGVLVHEDEAKFYKVRVGDALAIEFPRGGVQELRVAGIYRNKQFSGGIPVTFLVSTERFDAGFTGAIQDTLLYVKAKPGRASAATRQTRAVLRDFPNVTARTPEGFRKEQEGQIDQFLAVLYALLLLAQIIAILGIVNTLALSVFERTRELGMLRAVGMSRRQVRRMVRGESVIIAVIGGVIGLGVGLFWGWAMTRALRQQGITRFSVPPGQLVAFVIVSALAGVVAAVLPAWRASRLDVLEAIATE